MCHQQSLLLVPILAAHMLSGNLPGQLSGSADAASLRVSTTVSLEGGSLRVDYPALRLDPKSLRMLQAESWDEEASFAKMAERFNRGAETRPLGQLYLSGTTRIGDQALPPANYAVFFTVSHQGVTLNFKSAAGIHYRQVLDRQSSEFSKNLAMSFEPTGDSGNFSLRVALGDYTASVPVSIIEPGPPLPTSRPSARIERHPFMFQMSAAPQENSLDQAVDKAISSLHSKDDAGRPMRFRRVFARNELGHHAWTSGTLSWVDRENGLNCSGIMSIELLQVQRGEVTTVIIDIIQYCSGISRANGGEGNPDPSLMPGYSDVVKAIEAIESKHK